MYLPVCKGLYSLIVAEEYVSDFLQADKVKMKNDTIKK